MQRERERERERGGERESYDFVSFLYFSKQRPKTCYLARYPPTSKKLFHVLVKQEYYIKPITTFEFPWAEVDLGKEIGGKGEGVREF